jgi:hypothetical protein
MSTSNTMPPSEAIPPSRRRPPSFILPEDPSPEDLAQAWTLSDRDKAEVLRCRGDARWLTLRGRVSSRQPTARVLCASGLRSYPLDDGTGGRLH